MKEALVTNDAIVFGILMVVLYLILSTSQSQKPGWKSFYKVIPALLLCYLVPGLLTWPLGLISPEGSNLYFVASRYMLPAAIILLCINIDFKNIKKLGPKALAMFFTATISIILGGPFAILLIQWLAPDMLGLDGDSLWRGLSTVAGSWIGGSANQTAMKEIYDVSDEIFGNMLIVDILMANVSLGLLLFSVNFNDQINAWLKADDSDIKELQKKMEDYHFSIAKIPGTIDYLKVGAVAFGGVAASHLLSGWITPVMNNNAAFLESIQLHSLKSSFFWLIVIATTVGLVLSFTKWREIEGVGASKWATVFIYILVATIGMKMNISEILEYPGLFLLGFIWISFHIIVLIIVAKIIRAPLFFIAVGSQANIGGAASAPVVASAFHSTLAPVGVLLAVLGYALGTYGAIICASIMSSVAH